jgi:hypothetical protein
MVLSNEEIAGNVMMIYIAASDTSFLVTNSALCLLSRD